eukprot:1918194-Prymnesium_polylepis.1
MRSWSTPTRAPSSSSPKAGQRSRSATSTLGELHRCARCGPRRLANTCPDTRSPSQVEGRQVE